MAHGSFEGPLVSNLLRGHAIALLLGAAACSGTSTTDSPNADHEPGTSSFISHVPGQSEDGRGDGDAAPTSADANAADISGAESAERAITEADIIQVDGDRLYALSRYSGLSIIDIGDPTDLTVVGNYRSSATPFEMYLEGDMAYVMYNGWYSYVWDEDTESYRWDQSSRMQALDVSSPDDIEVIADLEVPGAIADSRKVGDIIYLATHESGYCWGCDDVANSRVTSFDVSTPGEFSAVDSVVFQTEDGWQRSISVTQERIYVSGWTWSGNQNQGGTIDVVDITDPAGDLQKGTSIAIAGQIESRWQMDEFDGTLRVISQPGGWGTTTPPVVETFQVNSADDIVPLASLDMVLPRPEDLRSVRFDGDRAFAITFERTDPLFTFDLSDPANPVQVGELEIPGWVYHMEPRGDRIYALGFEGTNEAGALHVSLFDVSDMANPTQLDRVNFGGDWGGFAEDQDRIHKAFNILTDEGLILVPYYGGGYDEVSCRYDYGSGIQLIDMTTEDLTLRGVAPQVGSARRALLHDGNLLGIGDNAVQSFDISDRDAPVKLDQLDTARNITNIRLMGETMLRFGNDWWTDQTMLDFTTVQGAETAQPLGELDLASLVAENGEYYCEDENGLSHYSSGYWGGQIYVHGSHAYVPRFTQENRETSDGWESSQFLKLFIVDISNQTNPEVVGTFEVDPINTGDQVRFAGIVQTEGALLIGRTSGYYYYDDEQDSEVSFSYDVIDLSDPVDPTVVERFEVPSLLSRGGWGYGISGCAIDVGWGWWGYCGYYGGGQNALVSGDIVASQHEEPLDDGTGRVRYYLDRLDVTDPETPQLLDKVNIPGNLVHFDAESGRIVTIDYLLEETPASNYQDCYDENFYGYFDQDDGVCRTYRRRLNVLDLEGSLAILKDSYEIDREARAQSIAISEDRIFFNKAVYDGPDGSAPPVSTVTALSFDGAGQIETLGSVELDQTGWWWGQVVARDGRAFLTMSNELLVVDENGGDVELTRHPMAGWGCNQLEVRDDVAYCAMGQYGVKSFPLD